MTNFFWHETIKTLISQMKEILNTFFLTLTVSLNKLELSHDYFNSCGTKVVCSSSVADSFQILQSLTNLVLLNSLMSHVNTWDKDEVKCEEWNLSNTDDQR